MTNDLAPTVASRAYGPNAKEHLCLNHLAHATARVTGLKLLAGLDTGTFARLTLPIAAYRDFLLTPMNRLEQRNYRRCAV